MQCTENLESDHDGSGRDGSKTPLDSTSRAFQSLAGELDRIMCQISLLRSRVYVWRSSVVCSLNKTKIRRRCRDVVFRRRMVEKAKQYIRSGWTPIRLHTRALFSMSKIFYNIAHGSITGWNSEQSTKQMTNTQGKRSIYYRSIPIWNQEIAMPFG